MIPLAVCVAVSDAALWGEIQSALLEIPVRVAFEQAAISELPSFVEKLERMRPDVVLLDLAASPVELRMFVETVSSTSCSPMIVVVHPEGRPEVILSAMRAGAKEFLVPPLLPSLQVALTRLAAERERSVAAPRRRGRVLGFLSAKGGCGSTTLACHTAAELERETAKSTLLCDLDLSSGLVRFLMHSKSRYSVLDALANVQRLDHSYWHALISNGRGRLDVLSGPETPPLKDLPNGQQVRQMLRFARSEYDWVALDLGRGLCPVVSAAIEELDDLVLVTTPDVPALHLAKQIIQQIFNRGFARNALRLVLNRLTRSVEVTPDELEKIIGVRFYATLGDHEHALREAYSEACLLPPESALVRELNAMAARLANLPAKSQKRFSLFGRG